MKRNIALLLTLLVLIGSCQRRLRIPEQYISAITTIRLTFDGIERKNLLYFPSRHSSARMPLLLLFHGGGGTPEGMVGMDRGRILELADRDGFAVLYPEGVGKSWNDLREDPISEAHRTNRDDVAFIRSLVNSVAIEYPVDRSRIYVSGISNGGFFSFRLVCEASDLISGAFPVTANLPEVGVKKCRPSRSVDLIVFNGTEDPLVPYDGGEVSVLGSRRGKIISTGDTMEFFRSRFACSESFKVELAAPVPGDPTRIIRHRWNCPRSHMELYEIGGGGHTWPGGVQYLGPILVGRVSMQLSASEVIADRIVQNTQ